MVPEHSAAWQERLRVYSTLTRLRHPRTFSGKILFVVFLGTYLPLLALLTYALLSAEGNWIDKSRFLLITLAITLLGTAVSLYLIRRLMAPISMTYAALRGYLEREEIPTLPTGFTDEAGVLMADATYVIGQLDTAIQRLTNFDPVTALPSRNTFLHTLHQAFSRAQTTQSGLAVVAIDLRGVEEIQWGLSDAAAESALRVVALRLMDFGTTPMGLARVGPYTFALLLFEGKTAEPTVRRILGILSEPMALPQADVRIGVTIGIARWPQDSSAAEGLLACAEATAESSRHKEGRIAFYNGEEDEALRRRSQLEARLREASTREEFQLAYQPIVDVRLGKVVAAEALLRWEIEGVSISPAEFIPIVEQTGLMLVVGEWVLRRACAQALDWQGEEHGAVRISVNVSCLQLTDPKFVIYVADALRETGLAPELLQIEVTESTLMENVEIAAARLAQIRALGVAIAVDDFGTGYSSLSSLKRLPIDVLKVDQSFVRSLPDDEDDIAIVRSVSALAVSLRMEAVAEGVETLDQARCLMKQGYRFMQGYFFGRPGEAGIVSNRLLQEASIAEISRA